MPHSINPVSLPRKGEKVRKGGKSSGRGQPLPPGNAPRYTPTVDSLKQRLFGGLDL